MANRIFLHIGAPKSGTTYLQTVLWANRENLRRQGLLMPGRCSTTTCWPPGRSATAGRTVRRAGCGAASSTRATGGTATS